MYTVIGGVRSRAFRILWMLEELGAHYTHVPEPPRSDAVRALNPTGKIPVLKVDEDVLTDSVAIMTYLADRHGALTHPAGTIARARQDALTCRILDEIDALLWMAARHSFVLPEGERLPQIKESLQAEYARNIESLASGLDGPYLTGEMMTVPDILLTHCCNWAIAAKFPEPPKRLAGYLYTLRNRPAFKRVRDLG